ncbi:MAG: MerR family transcriptional regulator [Oscillibacter sp.]|nr:MerR family transcriptional regulator [Oscillibacter sp.]
MYQIGEFSKICQVSVKTLRYYDKIGVLRPSEVDRFTGYRYYDRAQLEKMLLIQKLKRYGFSLDEIQPLLSCGHDAFYSELRRQRDKLQDRLTELEAVLRELTLHLGGLERTDDKMNIPNGYEIKLTERPSMAVFSCRQRMGVDEFGKYFGTLYERISKEGLTPGGVVGAMYHDEEFHHESSDIELFVSVRERDCAEKVMDACPCAMTVHRGGYSTLNEAYAALVSWIEENGYQWDGTPCDIYTRGAWHNLKPEDWETEVYFPVRKREKATVD